MMHQQSNVFSLLQLSLFCVFICYLSFSLAAPDENCATGCSNGNPRLTPFEDMVAYPTIALCEGNFTGYVSGASANSLCAVGWHVCSASIQQDAELLKNLTSVQTRDPPGCFPIDGADDFGSCKPCTGNVHEDDIVAIGADCEGTPQNLPSGGCFAPGTSPYNNNGLCCHGFLTSAGCQHRDSMTGITCCANNFNDPCFDGECPESCCGNGVCDRSTATCFCEEGFTGADCCTSCNAITNCTDCIAEETCAWCIGSRSCTRLDAPECLDFSNNATVCIPPEITIIRKGSDIDDAVTIGAAVGGSVAGLLALIGAGVLIAVLMFFIFSRGEYAEMWSDFASGSAFSSPLYEASEGSGVSPLYVGND